MTVARSQLVDPEVTPYYHCISRCVRRAFLCGGEYAHRKAWIENRLQELSRIFAIEVCGYAVLDNHLHVLVRVEPERASGWSDDEVVRRWGRLYPPRGKDRQPLPVTKVWIEQKLADTHWVAETRKRLSTLGWFMKCLKEPLARMANREDKCHGAFWESRFKSIAILDDEALLATLTYIDLNPVAAGQAELPEKSAYTSVRTRVEQCRERGTLKAVKTTPAGTVPSRALEDGRHWLCPIEDRRRKGQKRAGMLEGFTLSSYLCLIDWTSRLHRTEKAHISEDVTSLLNRLGTTADIWRRTMERLHSRDRELGVVFAFDRTRLREVAARRQCSRVANINGCPA